MLPLVVGVFKLTLPRYTLRPGAAADGVAMLLSYP